MKFFLLLLISSSPFLKPKRKNNFIFFALGHSASSKSLIDLNKEYRLVDMQKTGKCFGVIDRFECFCLV